MLYKEGSVNFRGDANLSTLRKLATAYAEYRDRRALETVERPYFSGEAMRWLVENQYTVLFLNGDTIEESIHKGLLVEQDSMRIASQLTNQRSRRTQVAIRTVNPFIESIPSNDYQGHLLNLEQYNFWLASQMPEMNAVLGSVADYAELIRYLRAEQNIMLFGLMNSFRSTQTSTILQDGSVATIGCYCDAYGLCVDSNPMTGVRHDTYIAPIIVPISR